VSESNLVRALLRRLHEAGYDDVPTPFRVASVDFQFTAALRGRKARALDLVLVVDTSTGDFGDRDPRSVRLRVEALSRALDVTQSRYVLTIVLAGAALAGDVDALTQVGRVLNVEAARLDDEGRPVDAEAAEALDDQIRLLLPLTLPSDEGAPEDRLDAMAALHASLSANLDAELSSAVIAASARGEGAVTGALSDILARALVLRPRT